MHYNIKFGGQRSLCPRRRADWQVGHLQSRIRPTGRKQTKDLSGQLRIDHVVMLIELWVTGRRRHYALQHKIMSTLIGDP